MDRQIAIAKRGKTFKVWGAQGFVNEQTGEGEVIYFYGRIGLRMDQLTSRRVRGKWAEIATEARRRWEEKVRGEYTSVPAHEYWGAVEAFQDTIEALIEKNKDRCW